MIKTGNIYKIINSIDNEIYIGSTFNELRHRWQQHKASYNRWLNGKCRKCSIFEKIKLLGIKNFKIMLIKKYDVYRDDSKDRRHLLSKEQLWINKLKCINEKGAFNPIPEKELIKIYRLNNKDKIKEKAKEYKLNNKDKKKQYYENNKEKIKEKSKEYKLNNKEKLNKKINCSCGGKYQHRTKARHMKTKIHMNSIK